MAGGVAIQGIAGPQAAVFNWATAKAGMREQERAQRAAAQASQPTRQAPSFYGRQAGMGKNDRDAIAFKQDIAHARLLSCAVFSQGQALGRGQQTHAKMLRLALTTRSQRIRFC